MCNSKGFSLIELMVVVAIIGILSAVAVPQFQKFQRKAKQAEAKSTLSSIYLAQKVFSAENGTYYTNFKSLGVGISGVVTYRAAVNYSASSVTAAPGYNTGIYVPNWFTDLAGICSSTGANAPYQEDCSLLPVSQGGIYLGHFGSHYSSLAVTQNTFVIGAGRILVGYGDAIASNDKIDIWTINQRKELTNVANGAL